ncbi:MAG: hypothetical protein GXP29_05110 [Planctomycetes bacterium]|nr:hypothetical protein [Planctomycetota bacterium]
MRVRFFILTVVISLPVLVGCANERSELASIQRWENIGAVFQMIGDREREYPSRSRAFDAIVGDLQANHQERLRVSTRRVQSFHQREVDRWPQRLARTREDVRQRMAGHPEKIPDAVAGMWY